MHFRVPHRVGTYGSILIFHSLLNSSICEPRCMERENEWILFPLRCATMMMYEWCFEFFFSLSLPHTSLISMPAQTPPYLRPVSGDEGSTGQAWVFDLRLTSDHPSSRESQTFAISISSLTRIICDGQIEWTQ